jgi:hypothetical protein
MAKVHEAQLIRYVGPQYLVEPVGEASDQEDIDTINASDWDAIDAPLGWEPYNAIIRVWDDAGTSSWTYLALVED